MIAQPIVPGKTYQVSIGDKSTEVHARNGVQALFLAIEQLNIKPDDEAPSAVVEAVSAEAASNAAN